MSVQTQIGAVPVSTSVCPHCKANSESGTHNGCANCRKVKHTNGKIIKKQN